VLFYCSSDINRCASDVHGSTADIHLHAHRAEGLALGLLRASDWRRRATDTSASYLTRR